MIIRYATNIIPSRKQGGIRHIQLFYNLLYIKFLLIQKNKLYINYGIIKLTLQTNAETALKIIHVNKAFSIEVVPKSQNGWKRKTISLTILSTFNINTYFFLLMSK